LHQQAFKVMVPKAMSMYMMSSPLVTLILKDRKFLLKLHHRASKLVFLQAITLYKMSPTMETAFLEDSKIVIVITSECS